MPARLYPRINNQPGSSSAIEVHNGNTTTPLGVSGVTDAEMGQPIEIMESDADTAVSAQVNVAPGGPVPTAHKGLLPFFVALGQRTLHIRVAVIGNPEDPQAKFPMPEDLHFGVLPSTAFENGRARLFMPDEMGGGDSHMLRANVISEKNISFGVDDYGELSTTQTPLDQGPEGGTIVPLELSIANDIPDHGYNTHWFLVVRSRTQVWLTFAVTEGEDDEAVDAALPWIHIDETNANHDLGGPFTPGVADPNANPVLNVRNFGPGPLTIRRQTINDATGSDVVELQPVTIQATNAGSIPLTYTADDGITNLPVAIEYDTPNGNLDHLKGPNQDETDEAYHNNDLSLTAGVDQIGAADTVLVLDASGSMLLRPDGMESGDANSDNPALRRRWDNVVTAVHHLADGYKSFLSDDGPGAAGSPNSRLGIAVFPDVLNKGDADWSQRAGVLFDSRAVSDGDLLQDIENALDSAGNEIDSFGLTPIGEGIGVAMGEASSSEGMFASGPDDARRWLVLMTDGAQNAGETKAEQFYVNDEVPDFVDKGVRVMSIAYTSVDGGAAVELMQDIAEGADQQGGEGHYVQAATTAGFEKNLTETFLDSMATTLGLAPAVDPPGELSVDNPIAIHEFHVSPFDSGVGVFVDWQTRSRTDVAVALISPNCERFSEAELTARDDFRFRGLPAYAHAYISAAALHGNGTTEPSRFGTWKLELRLVGRSHSSPSTVEPYKFNVFHRSSLRLDANTAARRHCTGDVVEIVARLGARGRGLANAKVVATIDAPLGDLGTQLAGIQIDRDILQRTNDRLQTSAAELSNTWSAKLQAIGSVRSGGLSVGRSRQELVLHEREPGVYVARINRTAYAGVYTAHIVATGFVDGIPYRRERAISVNVESKPNSERTRVSFALGSKGEMQARVFPRDAFGNAVIFDTGDNPRLGLEISGAEASSELGNKFDGSYEQTFKLGRHGNPHLTLRYDGRVVEDCLPVPDPRCLHWMKNVFVYDHGPLADDHQKYADPKKALGSVMHADDSFVALGGGRIVLGVGAHPRTRRSYFYATHISVFISEASNAGYRVSIRSARSGRRMILGESSSPAQVFRVSPQFGPIAGVMIEDLRRNANSSVLLQGVGYGYSRSSVRPGSHHHHHNGHR